MRVAAVAVVLVLASAQAVADGGIEPKSPRDTWTQQVTSENGQPLIHSLRAAALELVNRGRYRWRVGISWRFRHALDNGMPGAEDRGPMNAIDDAIERDFSRNDESRIVYFTTGGGLREVMLYSTGEAAAWARVDALFKQFPAQFPGKRAQWAYVEADADWSAYRAIVAALRASAK